MQTQGFQLQENASTGMQSMSYAKVVFWHSTSVGRKYVHMYQVPNPYAPPQTAIPIYQYLITSYTPEMCWLKKLYHIVLLLDFLYIYQQR